MTRLMTPSNTGHSDHSFARTVLVNVAGPDRLALVTPTYWDQIRTRLTVRSLDRQLADGTAPETEPRLAIRAEQLTRPDFRRALAEQWQNIVDRAGQPVGPSSARVPVARGQVLAAADDIDELVALLNAPRLVAAAGVASARELIVDGTGPVYRDRLGADLAAAIQSALMRM